MIKSVDVLHESACDLYNEEHEIRDEWYDVMTEAGSTLVSATDWTVDVGAVGCNSCAHTDKDVFISWVAQNPRLDYLNVKYDGPDRHAVAEAIVETAESMSVPVSWNGNTQKTVVLGLDDYYTNLDPGTRVTDSSVEGTIIDPDLINDDEKYKVVRDGELLGKFDDIDLANAFAELTEGSVKGIKEYARRDGVNLVVWDGSDTVHTVRTHDVDDA